jgi:hypothetical protein
MIESFAVSPNGKKCVAVTTDGALLLYDVAHAFEKKVYSSFVVCCLYKVMSK